MSIDSFYYTVVYRAPTLSVQPHLLTWNVSATSFSSEMILFDPFADN